MNIESEDKDMKGVMAAAALAVTSSTACAWGQPMGAMAVDTRTSPSGVERTAGSAHSQPASTANHQIEAEELLAQASERRAFSGSWSAKWCDKTNPKLDCGGFSITLLQEGDRICGDFGGALVNLRQVDDGSIVGAVVGKTAILAVESNRNGDVALVRLELRGNDLHWKEVDSIRRSATDISIIAIDEVLTRDPGASFQANGRLKEEQTCKSFLGRQGD